MKQTTSIENHVIINIWTSPYNELRFSHVYNLPPAGAWSWPITSNYCRRQECVDIYRHSPNTP